MAVRIACTHCSSSLSMPETMYGKPVRCPKCQQIFDCPPAPGGAPPPLPESRKRPATMPSTGNPFDFVESAAPPPPLPGAAAGQLPAEQDVDIPRPRLRKQGWDRACQGSLFLCISAGLYLAFYFVFFLVIEGKRPPEAGMAKFIMILEAALFVGAGVMGSLGMSMFAAVPAASGAKGPASAGMMALMLCSIASLLFTILIMIGPPSSPGIAKVMFWLLLGTITSLVASFALCVFFLTISAVHLQSRAMLGSVVAHGVFLMVSPFLLIGFQMFAAQFGMRQGFDPDAGRLTGTFMTVLLLGAVVWFIVNVLTLHAAVARARRKGLI